MTVDFAALTSTGYSAATDTPTEDLRRFRQLHTRGGALFECDNLCIWASRPDAILRQGDWVLCGLVMLDNRVELLELIAPDTHSGADTKMSDLEIVMALCAARGADGLLDLSGSFSLVLWNSKTQKLSAIRDHFGVYPLYRAHWSGQMVLSSDLRLSAHLTIRPLQPSHTRVSAYLCGFEDSERSTAFAGLDRVPRAHMLYWRPGQEAEEHCYWQLELPDQISLQEAVPALRRELTRAVQTRMGAQDEVGCMLSGGLDSSSIAVLAAAHDDVTALKTLSFVYRETDNYDESAYIEEVNQKIAADPILIRLLGPPSPERLADLLDEQFDLCPAPGLLKSRQIYSVAGAQGMNALMDGHGGDEVISHGYIRQAELATQGEYLALWREMRGASRIYGQPMFEYYLAYLYNYAPWRRRSLLRRGVGWIGRRIATKTSTGTDSVALLAETYRQKQDVVAREAKAAEAFTAIHSTPNERLSHLYNVTSPMIARSFEVLRRSAVAQGVEPIYPFFDKALVQMCLSVPPEGKMRGGWSRRILRDAMEGLLPKDVQWRTDKADFSHEVAGFVEAYLQDPNGRQCVDRYLAGIVDLEKFQDSYNLMRSGSRDNAAAVVQVLWRGIYLAAWLEQINIWNRLQKEGNLW